MEKMACFGLELIDSNVTTSKGAMLVTACVEVWSKNLESFVLVDALCTSMTGD